jgi:hypothetical protein
MSEKRLMLVQVFEAAARETDRTVRAQVGKTLVCPSEGPSHQLQGSLPPLSAFVYVSVFSCVGI